MGVSASRSPGAKDAADHPTSPPDKQTHGLRVLHEPVEPLVDIIFVHGLTGSSSDTWLEANSGIYWPVQLLSKDVPDARIMAFGYDADVTKFIGAVGQNDIRDHASNLIGDLAARRARDSSNGRKIIFIVHSLGGLVVKKAIYLSEQAMEPHLKQLDHCTIAIAFLGTPHRGSSLTPFASSVANILKAGSVRVNTNILRLLHRDSEVLADIEASFGIWMRKNSSRFNVTCFFEELELPIIGMVVAKESAKIDGYPQLSIPANHMNMTKFSTPHDIGYMRILGEVNRWQAELEAELSQDELECLKSLSFLEMNSRGNDIKPAADGTCAWLLHHKLYENWIFRRRGLLWIKGNPGVGKSTLLKYAFQAAQKEEPLSRKLHNISFFFHGRGAEIQRTPLGLFRALLHQLLGRFPRHFANVVQDFKTRNRTIGKPEQKWNWRQQELQGFIEASLPLVLGECAIRIFIDALDECGEKEARELLQIIHRLHTKCSTARYGLSICFSCRHYPVVSPDNCLEIRAEDENHQDIKRYIRGELQSEIHDPQELQVLQEKLEAQSGYIFQWIVLVIPQIRWQYHEGKTFRQILDVLQQIPQELNDLYEAIIQRLKEKDQLQSLNLLQWICFARRPLSISELRCAMNVDANPLYRSFQEWQKLQNYIETDKQMERQLRSLSGGLAEIKRHERGCVAQLIHQSVNDYLVTEGFHCLYSPLHQTNAAVGYAHTRLSRSCIVYFAMDEIKTSLSKDGASLMHEYPLLEYATKTWLPHAKVAEENGVPQEDLLDYLDGSSAWVLQQWITLYRKIGPYSGDRPMSGTTIYHAASEYNLISVLSAILNDPKGDCVSVDPKDDGGRTPLSCAAGRGCEAAVNLLLTRSDVDVNSKDAYDRTPLSWAAGWGGSKAVVNMLLARDDVEVNPKDADDHTPLSWAAEQGHEAVVKLMLTRKDINVNPRDGYDRTPLLRAAWWGGREAIVKLLLARDDIEVNPTDRYGRTPLSRAAWGGHEAVAKLLLVRDDVDVNLGDKDGQTPLSLAAWEGCEPMTKLLLAQKGIKVNLKDKSGCTPLSLAVRGEQKAKARCVAIVEILLKRYDIEVNTKDNNGLTPLSLAALYGCRGSASLLLKQEDIDVNSKDNNGRTPLSWAAEKGGGAMVGLLLAREDTEVNSKDKDGRTPLWQAVGRGSEDVVKLLLTRDDIEVDSKDKDGRTPLWQAVRRGSEDVVKLLLTRDGIDVNSKDKDGQTPLLWAAERRSEDRAKLIFARGDFEVNAENKDGYTPQSKAAGYWPNSIATLLLNYEISRLRGLGRYIPRPDP